MAFVNQFWSCEVIVKAQHTHCSVQYIISSYRDGPYPNTRHCIRSGKTNPQTDFGNWIFARDSGFRDPVILRMDQAHYLLKKQLRKDLRPYLNAEIGKIASSARSRGSCRTNYAGIRFFWFVCTVLAFVCIVLIVWYKSVPSFPSTDSSF